MPDQPARTRHDSSRTSKPKRAPKARVSELREMLSIALAHNAEHVAKIAALEQRIRELHAQLRESNERRASLPENTAGAK